MLSKSHEITSKNDYYSLFFSMQRRLWRVCTFAQTHPSLRHSTEISCADSKTICVPFIRTVNAVVRLYQQPWHISALYQCAKKCSQCIVIKILNKIFASLPRKKYKVVIVFWMLFHGNMTTTALRHADFPQFRQLD